LTPSEREAHWRLYLRFAIEADDEDEARAVVTNALGQLNPPLPLRGEPWVHPHYNIWTADVEPDLTHLQSIDPDDAKTRCRMVEMHIPGDVITWSLPQNTERVAKHEWPPDIWQKQPGRDDLLLHPAIRAVQIYCEGKEAD
jgi:hypothetical protein